MDKNTLIETAEMIIKNGGICNKIDCKVCPLDLGKPPCSKSVIISHKKDQAVVKALKEWLSKNKPDPAPDYRLLSKAFKSAGASFLSVAAQIIDMGAGFENLNKTLEDHNLKPLIRGRWLTWQDKDYYKVAIGKDAAGINFDGPDLLYDGFKWRLPSMIDINDSLACSRALLGDVWIAVWDIENQKPEIDKFIGIISGSNYITCYEENYKYARLATPEEIEGAK